MMNFKNHLLAFAALTLTWSCNSDSVKESVKIIEKPDKYAGISANDFASIQMEVRQFQALGVSMAFPKSWNLTHSVEQKQSIWMVKMSCSDSIKFCANYVLNVAPRQKGVSVKAYGDFIVLNLIKKEEDFRLVNRTEELINGIQSLTMDYVFTKNKINLGGSATLYFMDNRILILNFAAINEPEGGYVRYRGLFTRTISTVKILKKS